ncbi:hypothetical protein [Agromyces sp. Marseille-Q5079]|uniref:hypothetical protein n=1 Tax=Agromyces sp. Marseille-Q5079 TaxID=3439059 RepID=UPI003D9CA35B
MKLATRRTPIIVAVAAVLLLAGCSAAAPTPTTTPDAAEQPEASPTPTVEPEPVDPLTTVATIVVRPEQLELLDASDAVITTLSYDDEAAEFIGALTTVLGAAPAQSESEGGLESPPSTAYDWDGLSVRDDHEADVATEGEGTYDGIDMNVSVNFATPTVGDGVAVRTVNGFQPGGDAEALAAELGEPWYDNGYDQVRVETGAPIGEPTPGIEYENAYSVAVNTWEHDGVSNTVFAPWNFGIGHV